MKVDNMFTFLYKTYLNTSHDIVTTYEVLSMLDRRSGVMVATDCLNSITTGIFAISNATLLDRRYRSNYVC